MPEQSGKLLKVTLVKSPIGYNSRQKATVKSLGLRRMSQSVLIGDAPQIPRYDRQGQPPGDGRRSCMRSTRMKLHDLKPDAGSKA